jgi:hypothetical protein
MVQEEAGASEAISDVSRRCYPQSWDGQCLCRRRLQKTVFPSPLNGPRQGSDWQTFLAVKAWVNNVANAKKVWVDVDVFDSTRLVLRPASQVTDPDRDALKWSHAYRLLGVTSAAERLRPIPFHQNPGRTEWHSVSRKPVSSRS